MKKALCLALVVFSVLSCQKKEEPAKKDAKKCAADTVKKSGGKKFEMYSMSEMAALMEQMYAESSRVKQQVIANKPIGEFPDYYLNIHTAKFTDESENDAFFKEKAKSYIAAQQKMYADNNPANAKKNYNNAVDACIACHESKCGGPIPRIKKLYLK